MCSVVSSLGSNVERGSICGYVAIGVLFPTCSRYRQAEVSFELSPQCEPVQLDYFLVTDSCCLLEPHVPCDQLQNFTISKAFLEVLAGKCSYSYTLDLSPVLLYSGKVFLFSWVHSFRTVAHGAVRKEGDTILASQRSRINPGDQLG